MKNLAMIASAGLMAVTAIAIGSPSDAAVTPYSTTDPNPACSGIYYTGGGSPGKDITVYNCTKYAYLVDVYTVSLTKPIPHHYADVGLAAGQVKTISISALNYTSSPNSTPQEVFFTKIG
jgi:hypothetical protein